ncbi:MAG: porin family protein [Flavobacteriales bacterium]
MKRALATAWMALALGVAGWAQDRAPLTFNGGYTLGFSAAQVRGDGIEGFNKLGLYGGAVVDIRRFQNLGFQLGILYHEKGSKKVANPRTGDYSTWAYKFSYIDIPLVAVVELSEGYTVGTGLQPGVLLSALEDGLDGGSVTGDWMDTNLPIRPWELSWVVWIGIPTAGGGELFLRHSQSLPGIVPKPSNPGPNARWDDRMQNITLQVGYTRLLLDPER